MNIDSIRDVNKIFNLILYFECRLYTPQNNFSFERFKVDMEVGRKLKLIEHEKKLGNANITLIVLQEKYLLLCRNIHYKTNNNNKFIDKLEELESLQRLNGPNHTKKPFSLLEIFNLYNKIL